MATSRYFNKSYYGEQNVLEDLAIESIKINGIDGYYLPRTLISVDAIFTEDDLSIFERGYLIEMYPKNTQGFGGEKEILSKFGVEIREQITFVVSKRRYQEEIGQNYNSKPNRPLEGDLIYFPVNRSLYEVKFVDHDVPFYEILKNYVFELKCEKYEFSSERFETGIPDLDNTTTGYELTMDNDNNILDEDGILNITTESGNDLNVENNKPKTRDKGSQNDILQNESDGLINFDEKNPFGNV